MPFSTKNFFFLFLFALCLESTGFAQYDDNLKNQQPKLPLSERLVFGGNLGLQFGDVTIIDVSPSMGYKIQPNFIAGVGLTYQYYKDRRYTPTFSTSIYGGRVFSRYYFPFNVFAHIEYELLNYDAIFVNSIGLFNEDRITANNLYVGAGYRQPIGNRASFDILILYNLNESAQSLYENPVFRMGFNFGI